MSLRYPNGKMYTPNNMLAKETNKSKNISYSKRGMTLEDDINETNEYYLREGIAVIHKKPTPIQIVNVDYPSRSSAVIKEAYFKQPSTTDYNGVCCGKYIDFEAKETKSRTSFPLHNFHEHQITHMKKVVEQAGISFVILRFSLDEEIFLIESQHLFGYWDRMIAGGRKSIKKEEIETVGHLISIGLNPRIDYIKTLKNIYHF
ncbi:Holliday junction resolvase RecU [Heyndrickxia ginsengihumi]|uniref:Holliday junction resolvase RecU n=1 Tax=Heyndrickxia ginsengihumi TaxID=363870 RepID=A0A0A6VG93_9BACI|nr:Holliday junction resolvase RecU [Heyndrickxia ginsengihumi]KHD85644.1 Holliday junction resolvase [Heyndrickxia ginsengihumi]MBE6185378.1 Holliday junction resolvase RecU [Bacillus sp. (in: firmicutes)]